MHLTAVADEPLLIRRVYPAWSIEVPASFEETFIDGDGYWHAYDDHRSVSLTSVTLDDDEGPVEAEAIVRQMPAWDGDKVSEVPEGLIGWATTSDAPPSSRAGRLLSGILASHGRVLLVTVTSDDLDWARAVWLSIRRHPAPRARRPRAIRELADQSVAQPQ